MKKAIYDDNDFFHNYIDLRNADFNYNDMIEQPIVFALLGDVTEKSVLDVGCGYGSMTAKLVDAGARSVVGIDVSENMIAKAKRENARANARYLVMDAVDLSSLNEKFDAIVSCLAIHYIEDLHSLFTSLYAMLEEGGCFVFSMEHPMYTASREAQRWQKDENGHFIGFVTDSYNLEGVRNIPWLGKVVEKYHHTVSSVINALLESGFRLERVEEPKPTEEMLRNVQKTERELHRPAYLIVKCRKG